MHGLDQQHFRTSKLQRTPTEVNRARGRCQNDWIAVSSNKEHRIWNRHQIGMTRHDTTRRDAKQTTQPHDGTNRSRLTIREPHSHSRVGSSVLMKSCKEQPGDVNQRAGSRQSKENAGVEYQIKSPFNCDDRQSNKTRMWDYNFWYQPCYIAY